MNNVKIAVTLNFEVTIQDIGATHCHLSYFVQNHFGLRLLTNWSFGYWQTGVRGYPNILYLRQWTHNNIISLHNIIRKQQYTIPKCLQSIIRLSTVIASTSNKVIEHKPGHRFLDKLTIRWMEYKGIGTF